jgi:hypothetical protein
MPLGQIVNNNSSFFAIISGISFWFSFFAAYILLFFISRFRKKNENAKKIKMGIFKCGVFKIAQSPCAAVMDVVFIFSLIWFVIFVLLYSKSYVTYIALFLTVFSFQMHGMLNGLNFKYFRKLKKITTNNNLE